MRREIIKSSGGLTCVLDWPTIVHPLNRTLVVCIGGSGEYAKTFDDATIISVANKNGFAQDASNGIELPFLVISPIAGYSATSNMADHSLIMREISNVAKLYKQDYAFIGGLSLGAQTTTGMILQCRSGTEVTKGLESQYKNPGVWDGAFMISGKIPGTPQPCALPELPVMIFGNTGDTAVPIQNQIKTMDVLNSCELRARKVYPNKVKKYIDGVLTWVDVLMPEGALNKLIITIGGSHGTSWNLMYDWYAKSGPGYEFNQWLTKVAKPKTIECTATLDEINGIATFHIYGVDKVYWITKV